MGLQQQVYLWLGGAVASALLYGVASGAKALFGLIGTRFMNWLSRVDQAIDRVDQLTTSIENTRKEFDGLGREFAAHLEAIRADIGDKDARLRRVEGWPFHTLGDEVHKLVAREDIQDSRIEQAEDGLRTLGVPIRDLRPRRSGKDRRDNGESERP